MRLRTSANASIAAGAILELDYIQVLRFEQSLIQKIVEMQSGGNRFLLMRGQARAGDGFDLLPDRRKFFQHQTEIGRRNFDDVDRIERGAGRSAFDRSEQSDFAEVIAAT